MVSGIAEEEMWGSLYDKQRDALNKFLKQQQGWEYTYLAGYEGNFNVFWDEVQRLGQQGWEMVNIVEKDGKLKAFFKRALP